MVGLPSGRHILGHWATGLSLDRGPGNLVLTNRRATAVRRPAGVFLIFAAFGLAWCGVATADVFILTSGGRVVGELLNPDQVPRETYQIKTPTGGRITLSRSQVKEQLRPPPAEVEYEKIRPRYPDTVEGQWALAEWCRERTLLSERNIHLERILELDPDHEKARRALGYFPRDGEWKTQKQIMEEQGYVRYKGEYRLPQEIELMEERQNGKSARGEWMQKLDRWRDWLGGKRSALAYENIQSINDPAAVPALAASLRADPRDEARVLFIEALARIGTPAAKEVLAFNALDDPVPEVRLTCLDHLKKEANPEVVAFFIDQLRHADNDVVNRAGLALEHVGDPTAIGPLIDALVTMHKRKVQTSNPGQISTTFGTGGTGSPGGLRVGGGGPKIITYYRQNQAVLDALVSLTGGVNYGFNVELWKAWYAAEKRHPDLDTRRD